MKRTTLLLLAFAFAVCRVFGQAGTFIPSERFSSGIINDICQDKYGFIWIATENGLNKYDGYRFTTYLHQPDDSTTLSSNIVTTLYCDKRGQLWVGTREGLSRYDYAKDKFIHCKFVNQTPPRTTAIMERANGEFLFGTSGRGLYTIKNGQAEKIPDGYTSSGGNWFFNQMMEDSKGRFWKCGYGEEVTMKDGTGVHSMMMSQDIGAGMAEIDDEILIISLHGIYSYRKGVFAKSDIDLSALGSDKAVMCCSYQDQEKNIYIGTRGDGLFKLARGSRQLTRVECNIRGMDLNTTKVIAINGDKNGNIWVGCESKGLLMLPKTPPQFASWSLSAQGYNVSSSVSSICMGDGGVTWCTVQGNGVFGFNAEGRIVAHPTSPSPAEVIYRDKKGRYWIGTHEGFYSYQPLTGQSSLKETFECDRVNDVTEDGQGNIYVSTFGRGFCLYNPESHSFKSFRASDDKSHGGSLWNDWVLSMMPDSRGNVWLATSAGVSCYNPYADSFRPYGWDQLLDGRMCFSLCETKKGEILIGTDQGLYYYKPGSDKATRFVEDGGLADKTVGYIVQAANGDIWCATSMGIWQYDIAKKKFIGHVSGNGLVSKEYLYCVGMHTNDDVIYFATSDGLTTFRPSEVVGTHKKVPAVQLTEFMLAGHPINTETRSNGDLVATGPAISTDFFRVSYLDNTINMEFSLLDYADPRNVIFEYRIDGGDWLQNTAGRNAIQLSHLQPGTYHIDVRALSSGIYSPSKRITIKVTPPWYRSIWAFLIYLLGFLGLLAFIGWSWRRRATRQLDEEKMKFLINATHDIRSPLTLIMGPLTKLKNIVTDNEGKAYIDTIDRNAKRMMLLVNQILDERRLDKNQMQLHCRETNMVDFISGICKLFQFNASQRNIAFSFEHDKAHVIAWVDRVNFDKVISNLLSNAFKFSFDGGEVKVVLHEGENNIEIQVLDNGMGIKEEHMERLFDRFYQGRNSDDLGMQGTGIGLNLCRAITKMHGGEIKAQNRPDGLQGALFTISLPKGNKHLKPEQIVTDSPGREVLSYGTNGKQQFRAFRILIVDDDQEIADYIIGELGNRYKFDYSPNGKEALKTLLTKEYDLVISDVMMPEMDGMTLLKRIKENPQVSQMPVIMLTSKAEVEHKLEGLKSGADAYIAKPFNMEELHIQIDNLIDNVRRLRGKFSGAVQQEERVENIEVKGNDEALMDRVMRSVNAHMSDPNFNVDSLAESVGISRAQLHRKMKEITGISSGKFLRNLRMEQAARLLREGKVNISQVADRVGYNDQAHFSTAFKAHFGMSPSEYAETHKE